MNERPTEPVSEYFSVKVSKDDREIIRILQEKMDYKIVIQRVMKQFFSGESEVELDEKGFHTALEIWINLIVFTDDYVMSHFSKEIDRIKYLLYGERQPESN